MGWNRLHQKGWSGHDHSLTAEWPYCERISRSGPSMSHFLRCPEGSSDTYYRAPPFFLFGAEWKANGPKFLERTRNRLHQKEWSLSNSWMTELWVNFAIQSLNVINMLPGMFIQLLRCYFDPLATILENVFLRSQAPSLVTKTKRLPLRHRPTSGWTISPTRILLEHCEFRHRYCDLQNNDWVN
jgi:hypothetical protein